MVGILGRKEWQERAAAHSVRVRPLIADAQRRRREHQRHPIEDFLWEYYSFKPTQLERWHPGFGIGLMAAEVHAGWRGYQSDDGITQVSAEYVQQRSESLRWIVTLQKLMLNRQPRFGCFGLHEWAMVYRLEQSQVRHEQAPLRLEPAEIVEIVEAQQLSCTHFDAFRFYTDDARPLNRLPLTRETQMDNEQSGCLHANMDLYKWAYKSSPIVSSDLVLDCFLLARDIRTLDMRAAPYDLREWGLQPVRIETTDGKAEYVRLQQAFSERALPLRRRLIEEIETALAHSAPEPHRDGNF